MAAGLAGQLMRQSSLRIMMMMMLLMTMTLVSADVNMTIEGQHLAESWYNTEFQRQSLSADEEYFFLQTLTGLDLQDQDVDDDTIDRPQTTCVRKEYRRMTAQEHRAFHAVMNTMKNSGEHRLFVTYHRPAASPGAHFGPGFLGWHRQFLILWENAMKRRCSGCCLPYLDTRLDCELLSPSDSAIFTAGHYGGIRGAVRDGFAANWRAEPRDCNRFGNGVLTRQMDQSSCARGVVYSNAIVQRILRSQSYDQLSRPYGFSQFEREHGRVHVFIGGHMRNLPCAPMDPLFFAHHANVDKLGEDTRDRLPSSRWTYPNNRGVPFRHRNTQPMLPFEARNQDAMVDEDIGKDYVYERSPFDEPCNSHEECSPTGLLWCSGGRCRARCREGGRCRAGLHDSCYCPPGEGTGNCNVGRCRCVQGP